VASCRCVRPILIMWLKAVDFSWRCLWRCSRAGTRRLWISITAAICMAVGNLDVCIDKVLTKSSFALGFFFSRTRTYHLTIGLC
jgi:hypothetical protein